MNIPLDQMVQHLRILKATHGDESFHDALKGLFRSLLEKPGGEGYIQRLLAELGTAPSVLEALKADAKQAAAQAPAQVKPEDAVLEAIRREMPNCKTQAHFDIVLQSWDALRAYLDAAYGRDKEKAAQAREGLTRLLDLAPQVAELHSKLEENPDATSNRDYLDAPKQLTEHHKQQVLLAELSEIGTLAQLNSWYANAKPIYDSIVSLELRNELFDAIREKKQGLAN